MSFLRKWQIKTGALSHPPPIQVYAFYFFVMEIQFNAVSTKIVVYINENRLPFNQLVKKVLVSTLFFLIDDQELGLFS
jgi:hypothetical protein